MANEITVSFSLGYKKNSAIAKLSGQYNADQAGNDYVQATQNIGTTEENLDLGDIGTVGYIAVRNLDATNFVEFGSATGAYSLKVLPGKAALVAWSGSAVFAKADTAACDIEYLAIEA